MSDNASKKAITPTATLSYPHIAEPQRPKKPTDKLKYSATLVFAPGTDLRQLEAAVLLAAEEKFGSSAKEKLRTGALKSPFRKDAEAKGYEAGSVFINVRTERKPQAVYLWADPNTKKAAEIPADRIRDELYPGAKVRASIVAFAYDTDGNKGVSFALNNIQKMGDGDRLDNHVDAADEFNADLNAAPADLSSFI